MSDDEILLFHPVKKTKTSSCSVEDDYSLRTPIGNTDLLLPAGNSNLTAMPTFKDLFLDQWLIDTLSDLSIYKPTEIQSGCIPVILKGGDLVASAKTGSGKTAAFALPILQKLSQDPFGIYALVLTPTRELAMQIAEQFKVLGKSMNLKLSLVLGGLDVTKQSIELSRRPHIVVSTPGRLSDILDNSPDLKVFNNLQFLILDEADRLLNPSFREEIQLILPHLNTKRQTLLFSATLARSLEDTDFLNLKTPQSFHVNEEFGTVAHLEQKYMLIPAKMRFVYLFHILQNDFKDKTVIIFVGKCKTAEMLRVMARNLEITATCLHSQMPQNERIANLGRFKSNVIPILISTDVGSRGLDIPTVQVVINFDLPCDAKDYVHRIGRTARAGRDGLALSLVTEYDIDLVKNIESKIEKQLSEFPINENEVLKNINKVLEAKRLASMNLNDREFDKKKTSRRK